MSSLDRSYVSIARGPFTLISVLVALIIPQLNNASTSTLVACGAFIVGCLLTIHDFLWIIRTHLRNSVQQTLDNTVLDNLLRSIFDPETGWIASFVGMVMGNALMYSLPMDASQRVQLVRSTLGVEECEAQVILQSPGGIKKMLPGSFQSWLGDSATNPLCEDEDSAICSTDSSGPDLEPSPRPDSELNTRTDTPHEIANVELVAESRSAASRYQTGFTKTREPVQPLGDAPLPITILFHILRQMAGERIHRFAESVPKSTLLAVGASSTIGLLLHLSRNAPARRQVGAVLEGLTTLSLSSLVFASATALFAKRSLSLPQRPATESLLHISRILVFFDRRRWQCFVAFLVMFIIKQRRNAKIRKS
jgi:hypothetical protein